MGRDLVVLTMGRNPFIIGLVLCPAAPRDFGPTSGAEMTLPAKEAPYTVQDLLALPGGESYELVDGQLVERNAGPLSFVVRDKINRLLGESASRHGSGWTPPSRSGYQLFGSETRTVRRPDASFIRAERLTADQLRHEQFHGCLSTVPDVAVEVVPPADRFSDVVGKAEEYRLAGVRLVWLVNPGARTVWVDRPDGSISLLREDMALTGEDVLPEFRVRVSELFPPPRPSPLTGQRAARTIAVRGRHRGANNAR